ncbi:OLC1v1034274C3 [Oldenlandia corymbosa var. corymbosa]|uniref:OLC1v1034274C3 n=1 Tax=Oldenlandia corymbosa var. corymbosa TaxID=529605 RepID=A0AAV1CT66_OLDCO|nr:OLC1v1034274C3 [Oldenlandia corymbosa var. corymbosa]
MVFTSLGATTRVIGARVFNLEGEPGDERLTPVDFEGHGMHTASTAAGIAIPNANLFSLANGVARGAVPSAQIASYKVCGNDGCGSADLLAAFDVAIADRVDIISVSVAGYHTSFLDDPIDIGAFHAMKKGILIVCAGGNQGPGYSNIANTAPWIMTVVASSIDRKFHTMVRLGDGTVIPGFSINTFTPPNKSMYPLVNWYLNFSACDPSVLTKDKVKGRILYCPDAEDEDALIKQLGGVGIIRSAARAAIDKTVTVNVTAPFIASFSSREPKEISRNILKPDIAAPGIDILASYTTLRTMTGRQAAAAYVKTFHPSWSMAAIKSALMTTAKPMKLQADGGEFSAGLA